MYTYDIYIYIYVYICVLNCRMSWLFRFLFSGMGQVGNTMMVWVQSERGATMWLNILNGSFGIGKLFCPALVAFFQFPPHLEEPFLMYARCVCIHIIMLTRTPFSLALSVFLYIHVFQHARASCEHSSYFPICSLTSHYPKTIFHVWCLISSFCMSMGTFFRTCAPRIFQLVP